MLCVVASTYFMEKSIMDTSSPISNKPPSVEEWVFNSSQYWVPPVSIATAIFPVFYGFQVKSALQVGKNLPSLSWKEIRLGASKAAPILATQVAMQMAVESSLKHIARSFGATEKQTSSFLFTLGSSVAVGGVSVWALAAFNGQTMRPPISIKESIRAVSKEQARAIMARESCFFIGITASEPLGEEMQEYFGTSKAVKYTAAFASGIFGCLAGHPFDTILSCLQKRIKVETFRQCMQGGAVRSFSGGVLTVIYTCLNDTLQRK
jgi:hypothetical protein